MIIHDALEDFLIQLEANGRSRHTIDQYRRHVRSLFAWLAPEHDLRRVDHQTIARFLSSPAARTQPDGRPRKACVVNALRSSLRGFFAYCAAVGHTERDPARLVRRARCGPPPPKTMGSEEQERLLAVLRIADGGRDYALFHLLLRAGLRIGSALALEVRDIDLEHGEVHVRCAKGDRPAVVLLPREVRDHLRAYLEGRTAGLLFPGMTPRHANRRLKYWLARAGIQASASPHTLRHCFGQAVYDRTGDLLVTQAALGHASITSTTIYAKASIERIRAAVG
jgi:integrase/recombinase XerD